MQGDSQSFASGVPPPRHAVQLFDDEQILCESVARYIGSGLAAGDTAIVIATDQHWSSIGAKLFANAFDTPRALRDGRIHFLDVHATLASVLVNGHPDADRFESVIGSLVNGGAHVRAYGEMVGLLWSSGDVAAALHIEEFWSRLVERSSMSLLCAYVVDSADSVATLERMAGATGRHAALLAPEAPSRVVPTDARTRQIGWLKERARALEDEVERRRELETALREVIEARERLLVEVETDRARLGESEERQIVQRRRLELLQSITESFARAQTPKNIAAILVQEATAVLGAPTGGLWLGNKNDKMLGLADSIGFTSKQVAEYGQLPIDAPMPVSRCYAQGEEIWLESRQDVENAYPELARTSESTELSLVSLPLRAAPRCFGAFSLWFPHARKFTTEERGFLVALSNHAAQALDRARLFQEAERVEGSLRFLSEASAILAGSLEYEATLDAVVRLAVPRIADWAFIDMVNADGEFRRMGVAHVEPRKVDLGYELSRIRAPSLGDVAGPGRVVRTGEPEFVEEVSDELLVQAVPDPDLRRIVAELRLKSSICVPLRVRGRPAGALTLALAESQRCFDAGDVALVEELGRRASMAIDNAWAYREAKEANRVKDEFLATMSHELRTPLNAILGWSTLLRVRPDVDVKKAVEIIERNARAQVRLIEEILDISRIMTGKLRLDLKPIDLAAVLRASADVVSPSALAKGIALDVHLEVDPCPFYGDAGRLQQVFWNLLSNAVKFTPKGGRVEARLTRRGSDVEVTIKDTGKGIRRDFVPLMFQRFRQADSSTTRTEGGLGIGLAIVGNLVELHGGIVRAESPGEGLGATLIVLLPVRAVSMDDKQPVSMAKADMKLLSGLKVLVCEDDADSRDLLHEVLESEGATVRLAAEAIEALECFHTFRPDVLVSDIGLPLVDGYALIRRIRELGDEEGGLTPAIALTAYAGSEDARKAFSAGYQLHVTKPVDPNELAVRVASLAGRASGGSDRTL